MNWHRAGRVNPKHLLRLFMKGAPFCLASSDALDASAWQIASLGECAGGQFERSKELFPQDSAGMHGCELFSHLCRSYLPSFISLVGVRYFNVLDPPGC